jgi:hypothetical protein
MDEGEQRRKTALVWESQVSLRENRLGYRPKNLGKAGQFSHTNTGAS